MRWRSRQGALVWGVGIPRTDCKVLTFGDSCFVGWKMGGSEEVGRVDGHRSFLEVRNNRNISSVFQRCVLIFFVLGGGGKQGIFSTCFIFK